ncbi:MAG: c-type cytochrome [Verrucomicrobiaceae bacterium]|nr:c-type cytochrome [Verrucomicrobiaceae bacterium]
MDFPSTPPVEPQNAAKTFHVLDGFEMQLIAAEPLVTDPVALTYDADGRAYVCEMNDYPYTDKAAHKPSQENPTDAHIGKVRLLTDTDGDGVFDKATIFADGLSWPTGAACWKGGIFVTATPDVWYLKDTNDDGVADVRQRVFTGFKKLNVQAVMNNPIWGLDHRIYIAGGSNGGEIQRVPGSESVMPLPKDFKPLPIKRNDFSFDPSTGDVRLESGGARFGNTFDDWGNRFLCNIRNPCQHVVLPYRYLARNPYLIVPSALNDCAEAGDQLPVFRTSPPEPWREFRAKRWVQEGSHLPKSELVGAGVVTSSSGITVYRGDAYPKEYRDFAFVADVAGNLFYRMKLVPDGVTFKAVQIDGNKNFCTSDDLWFRPVNFINAPDGCLHVCDMYREVIEHPWSIPDDIHTAVDLLRGRDRGRIWRLAPKSGPLSPLSGASQSKQSPNTTPDTQSPNNSKEPSASTTQTAQRTVRTTLLNQASTTGLVALLDHPNAWHRETAQRLLFERQDEAAVGLLRSMATVGTMPQGRITSLWALEGMSHFNTKLLASLNGPLDGLPRGPTPGKLTPGTKPGQLKFSPHPFHDRGSDVLCDALADKSEQVQAHAIMIAESGYQPVGLADGEANLRIAQALLELENSTSVRVRLKALHALRAYDFQFGSPYLQAFTKLLLQDTQEVWSRALVFASDYRGSLLHSFPEMVRRRQGGENISLELIGDLAELAGVSGREIEAGISMARHHGYDDPVLRLVMLRLGRGLSRVGKRYADIETNHVSLATVAYAAQTQMNMALKANEPTAVRAECVSAAGLFMVFNVFRYAFPKLITPDQPAELQLAALEALSGYREPAVADMLIDAWPKMTPALRDKATTILLSRTDRIAKLLDAIEVKKITPAQLSVAAKATLGRQKTPALAVRTAKLIGDGSSSNRKEVIEKYLVTMGIKERDLPSPGGAKLAPLLGEAARGAKIYEMACMVCHKFADKGNDIGPHLGTIKAWSAEQLVTNILDPNREVSPNFALYIVETNDGRTLSGLIASETAGNLTLKRADGGMDAVLRSEIKSLTSPGISLMPEGLEAAITPQQMADLIAYLKTL